MLAMLFSLFNQPKGINVRFVIVMPQCTNACFFTKLPICDVVFGLLLPAGAGNRFYAAVVEVVQCFPFVRIHR